MSLKELIEKYGKIKYGEYNEDGKWIQKKYSYEEFIKERPFEKNEEYTQCEYPKDERVYSDEYCQAWIVITNDGLEYAPTNGDYIQSEVHDDLFILMGHDGFNVYELKGYKK